MKLRIRNGSSLQSGPHALLPLSRQRKSWAQSLLSSSKYSSWTESGECFADQEGALR